MADAKDQNLIPVILCEQLSFTYGGPFALTDVNLRIAAREFVSVVGPNGGGKTTLLKLMLGLLRPTRGEVRVFGQSPLVVRRRIGYVPQHVQFDPQFPVTVTDIVSMGRLGTGLGVGPARRTDKAAVLTALEEVGLTDYRRRPLATLSGGQRQRVLIARALASEPELLLLDEPTANLDVAVQGDFFDLLHRLNERLTVLLVSHDVGFVSQHVQKVVCVSRTVEVHETSMLNGRMINDLYGGPVRAIHHDHGTHE
ncbi:MAG: ABC transporter ATP-binding protein [Planctomycetota bacterium]